MLGVHLLPTSHLVLREDEEVGRESLDRGGSILQLNPGFPQVPGSSTGASLLCLYTTK